MVDVHSIYFKQKKNTLTYCSKHALFTFGFELVDGPHPEGMSVVVAFGCDGLPWNDYERPSSELRTTRNNVILRTI